MARSSSATGKPSAFLESIVSAMRTFYAERDAKRLADEPPPRPSLPVKEREAVKRLTLDESKALAAAARRELEPLGWIVVRGPLTVYVKRRGRDCWVAFGRLGWSSWGTRPVVDAEPPLPIDESWPEVLVRAFSKRNP